MKTFNKYLPLLTFLLIGIVAFVMLGGRSWLNKMWSKMKPKSKKSNVSIKVGDTELETQLPMDDVTQSQMQKFY